MAKRLRQERGDLERHLGRPAAPADLYGLHLLGPAGAKNFLAQLEQKPRLSWRCLLRLANIDV